LEANFGESLLCFFFFFEVGSSFKSECGLIANKRKFIKDVAIFEFDTAGVDNDAMGPSIVDGIDPIAWRQLPGGMLGLF
jgi:hypothetical protein